MFNQFWKSIVAILEDVSGMFHNSWQINRQHDWKTPLKNTTVERLAYRSTSYRNFGAEAAANTLFGVWSPSPVKAQLSQNLSNCMNI